MFICTSTSLHQMSCKKMFFLLLAVSSLSLFLHSRGHFIWIIKSSKMASNITCSLSSAAAKTKHMSIAFLKTHKTASSTMQNILFRFAEHHNLTVALPQSPCDHQFCYPSSFSSRFVHPYTLPARIITSHMRFNHNEVQRIMPNDTIYVTILREPASMFESLFSYYNQYCPSFKRVPDGSLETFLKDPWRYFRPTEKDSMYAHNTLTYDLGGDNNHRASDKAYVKGFIAKIESIFSLVMISEYFDESLVLLRHLLSWELEDVLYIKQNMRTPGSRRSLQEGLPARIRVWNALDAKLYNHFNASLWRQLDALGLDCVAQEVQLLRQARDRLVRGCFGGPQPQLRPANQIKDKVLRPWQPSSKVAIMGYELPLNASYMGAKPGSESRDHCLKLILPEVQYSQRLLQMQSLRYRRRVPFILRRRPGRAP
ncbi:galactose-3-O-sulfotransferase 3-like [Brienomyrus brachyistius]|uniref:galactose-3-O-sulfotransferase 3-like n=1 Tax=Brienomyrus brachyistius TaxID=42636 RepID=UPI0020B3BF81|nr:galactose-3-O-sulfotransferase 3-like [Brienomyrus brachyistius]XP_048850662.1 galactose-3-O-sulfotransferase 3-like [Brienomyrus brachyistius]XP_048850663.1 galactose-3-O-sulfotransferase 3-like [Brienomyrus brachyistius]XP_048850664.1 galactose-3-O-sulfotransferase 3-like [Brienomyrus brachyistius]